MRRETRAKVAQLYSSGVLRNHDVIRFEICMDKAITVEQAEGYEELAAIQNYTI